MGEGEPKSYLPSLILAKTAPLMGLVRMNGKGDKRRPSTITLKEYEDKWEAIFTRPNVTQRDVADRRTEDAK